jgi:hypothetical protein
MPSVPAMALQNWDERLPDLEDPIFEEAALVTALAMQSWASHLWNGSCASDSMFQ